MIFALTIWDAKKCTIFFFFFFFLLLLFKCRFVVAVVVVSLKKVKKEVSVFRNTHAK